jgi:SAM-dependent methyltransferase
MLKRAKAALAADSNVFFVLQTQPTLQAEYAGRFDFVYSFDTFVHFDLHLMWREFCIVRDILKDGGRAFIHTTNLIAPDGWKTFASQDKYRVETMYFVSPEIIRTLADHAHLKIVKASNVDPGSFYLNRDYLVVLEKTEPCPAESSK